MTITPRYENHPAYYQLTTSCPVIHPNCNSANESVVNAQKTDPRFSADEWADSRKYQSRSGIRGRSKIEKITADFLFDEKIIYLLPEGAPEWIGF